MEKLEKKAFDAFYEKFIELKMFETELIDTLETLEIEFDDEATVDELKALLPKKEDITLAQAEAFLDAPYAIKQKVCTFTDLMFFYELSQELARDRFASFEKLLKSCENGYSSIYTGCEPTKEFYCELYGLDEEEVEGDEPFQVDFECEYGFVEGSC